METLRAPPIFCCKSSLNLFALNLGADTPPLNLSSIRQLGFPYLSRQKRKCSSIRPLTLSIIRTSIGSPDGSSSTVEDDKEGVLLGPERDRSGSVVGFHLIPQSDSMFFILLFNTFPLSSPLLIY